ncbi:hypothetical protein F5876DRAFT_84529 [Lentinula aff. lateritia]|uniref:Uncharacterized protein n=1 Tax=Lentinula aff. lateritia TaxID=2804960 RepID=A0ACC1TGA7_9AGAR|nr:hypothetical protein F5876DRAFT_84529 [Lentinula aff. lateritia]
MRLDTFHFALGLTMYLLATAWAIPLLRTTVDRRAPIVDVTIIPDHSSRIQQDAGVFVERGLEYAFRRMPELGLAGSSIRVSDQRVQMGPGGVNFQVHSGSSLQGTGHLKANIFVVPQSEMSVQFWNGVHLHIGERSVAHFNTRHGELVVVDGPRSDVDDMTHLLSGFSVTDNETHY